MKRCPECKQFFGDEIQHCPNDGTELVDRLPGKDPFMGRILAGRYEVLDLIGKGGFGVVFKVRDRKMEDVVALKVFDRRRFTDTEAQEAIKRFRREGVLLRRTGKRSNNIVTVYDFEEDEAEELFYFTMDYVEGTTLASILSTEGPLAVDRVLSLGRQVCSALNAAHFEGVVHRDLKLENLMVVREAGQETVKVLDFGIAKVVGSQSLTNLAVGVPGTPGYAPPEQLQSPDKIDGRTDLFALGVVLYGLLTGREPWQESTITEPPSSDKVWDLIRNSLEGEPTPVRKWAPEVPKPLEAAILKLLAKEQEDRFQSAEELDQELARIEDLLESERPKEPGSVTVNTESYGVKVAIRKGFRVVAQGTTPWTARSLRPGEYQVEIRDKRYHKETRKIVVQEAEDASVHLSATTKPPRPSPGEVLSAVVQKYRTPLMAAAVLIILAGIGLAVRPYLPGPRIPLSPEELEAALSAGEVVRTRIEGDRLEGVLRDEAGEQSRFRVSLARMAVQDLARTVRDRGVPLETSGTGVLRIGTLDESTGEGAPDVRVTVRRGGAGCSPCEPGREMEMEGGWYFAEAGGREWNLRALSVRGRSGLALEESLSPAGDSLFIPPEGSLELTAVVSPTPTRVTLAAGGEARARDDLAAALDSVNRVLAERPDHDWAATFRDSLAADVQAGARETMVAGRPDGADRWLDLCEIDPLRGEGCEELREWMLLRGRAGDAFEREDWALAMEHAEACLRLSPRDEDCAGLRGEAARALAEEEAPAPEPREPVETQPTPTEDPAAPPATETPPPAAETPVQDPDRPPPALVRALNEARMAMDRNDIRGTEAALRRAREIAPEHEGTQNLRTAVLARARDRVLAAFRAGNAPGARDWLPLCRTAAPEDRDCARVADWLEAKARAGAAMRDNDPAVALTEARRCVEINPSDGNCARLAEEAERLMQGPAEEEEAPAPPEPELPTPAASNLAIRTFAFDNGRFTLQGSFSAVGPGDAALCVASVFSDVESGPLQDRDGEFALGRQVAVTAPPPTPGPEGDAFPVNHTLPANQLDRPRGRVRVVATLKVWAEACGSVSPASPALAEVSSREICVFRYPGGWNLCRR